MDLSLTYKEAEPMNLDLHTVRLLRCGSQFQLRCVPAGSFHEKLEVPSIGLLGYFLEVLWQKVEPSENQNQQKVESELINE